MDIFATITDRIIDALENGTVPWQKPWVGGGNQCISYGSGKPYSLLNTLLLDNVAGEYITFRQATEAGGHVKKGEKAKLVVFWKPYEKVDQDTGEITTHFCLKWYHVFHLSQCEGISPRWIASDQPRSNLKPDLAADKIVKDYVDRSGVKLSIMQSSQAYYSPSNDQVVVPMLTQYKSQAEYYSTLYHELTHSTGHKSRLNRLSDTAAFGSEKYSKEELVAELGAAFLVNHVVLETSASFNNSAAYIQGWLNALKNDRRLIISAAGQAQKAVSLILGKNCNEDGGEDNGEA